MRTGIVDESAEFRRNFRSCARWLGEEELDCQRGDRDAAGQASIRCCSTCTPPEDGIACGEPDAGALIVLSPTTATSVAIQAMGRRRRFPA
jgi:hypothetical protein